MGSRVNDLATDAAGNLLVAGTLVDATGMPLSPLVAKLDPTGNLLWQDANLSTPGQARQLALDAAGNVYSLQSVRTAAGQDMQLVKFGPDGVRLWSRSFGATGPQRAGLAGAQQRWPAGGDRLGGQRRQRAGGV